MGQTLAERIQYEAAYDRNLIFKAYAGDLADLVAELTARAERAEAALISRIELCTELSKEIQRLRQRAERAEAELAAQRAMYDSLGPDWSHAPDGNPPPTHYVIDATGTAQWLWAMRGDVDALIEPIRNSGAWLLRNVYRTEVAALLDLPLGVDWRLCKWTRPSNNESEG